MALPIAVVVGDDTADKLIAKLKPLIAQLRVGPGLQQGGEENEMGPLVSSAHQKRCWVTSIWAWKKAPPWWPTAAIIRCRAILKATTSAARCSTM